MGDLPADQPPRPRRSRRRRRPASRCAGGRTLRPRAAPAARSGPAGPGRGSSPPAVASCSDAATGRPPPASRRSCSRPAAASSPASSARWVWLSCSSPRRSWRWQQLSDERLDAHPPRTGWARAGSAAAWPRSGRGGRRPGRAGRARSPRRHSRSPAELPDAGAEHGRRLVAPAGRDRARSADDSVSSRAAEAPLHAGRTAAGSAGASLPVGSPPPGFQALEVPAQAGALTLGETRLPGRAPRPGDLDVAAPACGPGQRARAGGEDGRSRLASISGR